MMMVISERVGRLLLPYPVPLGEALASPLMNTYKPNTNNATTK